MEVDSWIGGLPRGDAARTVVPWVVMAAAAALAATPPGRRLFALAGRACDRLAHRTVLAMAVVAAFAFALSASISLLVQFPEPAVHDEFSYMLAAETFARGRLTNPKHPLWEFFETVYVFHDPTYQSKYPPAQGLMLALGIVTSGEPIVGVWLSSALACGALTWMLLAWVPPRWAMAGGFLAALHPVMLQWGATYWGGAIAFAGGAFLLGALRRIWERRRFADGIILGIGILILANSRPYEALLLCIPVGVALLLRIFVSPHDSVAHNVKSLIIPTLLILLPGGLWMAWYNHRVTGHALTLPYVRHDQIYSHTPHFFFQDLRPARTYLSPQMARQHAEWEPDHWRAQQTFPGWVKEIARKTFRLTRGFFQPLALLIPLLALPSILRRDRWMQLALAILIFFIIGTWGITWNVLLHYAAPIAPLAFALLIAAMSEMSQRGKISRLLLQITLALFLFSLWPTYTFIEESQRLGPQTTRSTIINTVLSQYPTDKHLFIVRYLPGHNVNVEWVYNSADIDSQRIIWARDLGPEKTQALLDYYKTRRKWILEMGPHQVFPKPLGWSL